MSKIGRDRIIMLQESAENLGFETIEEALNNGYHEVQDLVNGIFTLEKIDTMAEQEKAHEAWLKERDEVLKGLNELWVGAIQGGYEHKILERAIDFIEKGEC